VEGAVYIVRCVCLGNSNAKREEHMDNNTRRTTLLRYIPYSWNSIKNWYAYISIPHLINSACLHSFACWARLFYFEYACTHSGMYACTHSIMGMRTLSCFPRPCPYLSLYVFICKVGKKYPK